MRAGSYENLRVWQKAVDLSIKAYKATEGFPSSELYGLTSQARRSAVSVAANIAEGYGRQSDGDFSRFLKISQGSLKELETHFHISQRLEYLNDELFYSLMANSDEVGRMLRAFISKTSNG